MVSHSERIFGIGSKNYFIERNLGMRGDEMGLQRRNENFFPLVSSPDALFSRQDWNWRLGKFPTLQFRKEYQQSFQLVQQNQSKHFGGKSHHRRVLADLAAAVGYIAKPRRR